ncbi:MAG: CRTAC1 family protein [Saprospiraceae bacterium]|nr:CRTAC1 family protein [Saprospiraceae bacterium]
MNYRFSVSIFLLIVGFWSCNNDTREQKDDAPTMCAPGKQDEATKQMVAELKNIAEQSDNIEIWHLNKPRAIMLDQQANQATDPGQKISLMFRAGYEWLNAGDYQTSIDRLTSIFAYLQQNNIGLPPETASKLKELLGIAYLRKAEIENCIKHHNEYSCIMPIEGPGQHVEKDGSQNAREIFLNILNENPNDLQAKWLYNLSQMTLGEYPDGVEPKHRLDPSIFESDVPFPRFTDKAMNLGLAVNDISGSVVMEDFNNDNYLDLMVSSYGLDDQLRYFENNGQGGFEEKTESAGLSGLWSGLNMVQTDYNNDGFIDVLVLRGAWLGKYGNHPNSLLKNNGNGTFSDVTRASGLYSLHPSQAASWADYNNDGWLDLFIGNEYSANSNSPSQFYQNNGDGTFTEIGAQKGLQLQTFIKGCVWGDYNNDGWMDLYISSITGENYLMKNGGPEKNFMFENVAKSAGVTEPLQSFPCWFFDYNQDGWEDIFVSGFDFSMFETAAGEVAKGYLGQPTKAELPRLYKNKGDGTFEEVSKAANVDEVLFTMGCNFGDINNDGFPDFYASTGTPDFRALIPNRMFLNNNGKSFWDVTKAGGFGHLQKGHGVAFGDIDNDGDIDIYHVLGGSYDGDNFMNVLFTNPGFENSWVQLRLEGTTSNRPAIGARVVIKAKDNSGKERTFYNRVNSGASFGASTFRVEQGLSTYSTITSVEIYWPGNTQPESISGVTANNRYHIKQGSGKADTINAPAIELTGAGTHNH